MIDRLLQCGAKKKNRCTTTDTKHLGRRFRNDLHPPNLSIERAEYLTDAVDKISMYLLTVEPIGDQQLAGDPGLPRPRSRSLSDPANLLAVARPNALEAQKRNCRALA
ncbi:hypothetical protein BV898_02203 [Hypsibius exemplaris]|uniref:Uncharacterized protein n=1 Tax=Hypsibius exemplaris TaxID=2072580 RepID=A0A1W0X8Y3_HYPEX|nr:hypothetical protein BV898_02203 [Hypsibius exemplaris]